MRFSNTLSLIRSSSEFTQLKDELGKLRSEGFQETKSMEVRAAVREAVLKDFELSKMENDTFYEELEKELDKLPELVLEIAFDPSEKLIGKIDEWLSGNMENKVIVDFVVNPSLIGGATVAFQGKFGDYSLSSKLSNEGF